MRRACCAAAALVIACVLGSCGSSGPGGFGMTGDDASMGGGDATAEGTVCPSGQTQCNGKCVDVTADPANCGSCGLSCDGGACCASVCVLDTASCAFSVTAANPREGNQNGGDWIKLTGNGFGAGLQVLIGDGVAPAKALDAHTAIVQTPPAPVGTYDITVVSGSMRATLPQSFLYNGGSVVLPWTEKPMHFVRGEDPGLAVAQDGRVLIVGGTTVPDSAMNSLDSAEVYTRANDTAALAPGKMSIIRWHSSAVTLLDGHVLVVGGATPSPLADLFDPTSGNFAATKMPMSAPRARTRSVLLPDGRVLISSETESMADIYDPDLDTFTPVAQLAIHQYGFIVRLRDGRALLGAGDGGVTTCEIFDPAQGKFIPAAPLAQGRSMLTAHTLPDGRVLVIGGATLSAGAVDAPLDEMELYDPKKDTWTVAPYKLLVPRTWHASALVRDGTVLVMGGYDTDKTCHPTPNVDQVDPIKGTVVPFGTLPHPNTEWTAVTLQDGSVLGVGGGACGTPLALPSLDFLPGKPQQQ
jgi:hypothetical protein